MSGRRARRGRLVRGQLPLPLLWPVPLWLRAPLAAWALNVRGDDSLRGWQGLVAERLGARFSSNSRTARKVLSEAGLLFGYLEARGVKRWSEVTAELVAEWCWAARPDRWGAPRRPAPPTAANRQWGALCVFEEAAALGAPVGPSALVGERIKRKGAGTPARPLACDEAALVEARADRGLVASRRSLLVAASFAGATATEIAGLRMGDVDVEASTIAFRGPHARTNPLGGWAEEAFARFVRNNPPIAGDALLCVSGRTDEASAAHSVTARLAEVLRDAGIAGREGVSARSIRLTTARLVLDAEGIEAAARFLGSPSLDTTAAALGHSWQRSLPGGDLGG